MPHRFFTELGLSEQEAATTQAISKAKTVFDWLDDAWNATKDLDYLDALRSSLSWADPVFHAAGEALPPVKFLIKLASELSKEPDPNSLALVVCNIAYQAAAMSATAKFTGGKRDVPGGPLISQPPLPEVSDFSTFSIRTALQHPFVVYAGRALEFHLSRAGYDPSTISKILEWTNEEFVEHVQLVLAHGDTKDKFEPLRLWLEGEVDYRQSVAALRYHQSRLLDLYRKEPVLGKEPFALADIYQPIDCGRLLWGEIADGSQNPRNVKNPFRENDGGRADLLDTVMAMIEDPKMEDAIVIQGMAGSGKSSFTLRLSAHLMELGLRPLRIRLRDMRPEVRKPLLESMEDALDLTGMETSRPMSLLRKGSVFDEGVVFGRHGLRMSRYVVILDGWDEISIAVSEGYQQRVTEMLREVRDLLLEGRTRRGGRIPVRVILTGRPSETVAASRFMQRDSPVLTIRPLSPDQLNQLVGRLRAAVQINPSRTTLSAVPRDTDFEPVLRTYEDDFREWVRQSENRTYAGGGGTDTLAVLGYPLLAQLAIRLISKWQGPASALISDSTLFLRNLVDYVCEFGARSSDDPDGEDLLTRLDGETLRTLLHGAATAISVYGKENIPNQELALRLGNMDLQRQIQEVVEKNAVASLMISFFFKGGHEHLGCEFGHKSFREYLFAEAIVKVLKEYGAYAECGAERHFYWQDFRESDRRFELSRQLARILAPNWLSTDVVRHLDRLLEWEIGRAFHPEDAGQSLGKATDAMDQRQWACVRNALADLWDWWGEGVHQRPQPHHNNLRRRLDYRPALVAELVEYCAPLVDAGPSDIPPPRRFATLDAHLGDGLFRLNCWVHWFMARQQGFSGDPRLMWCVWQEASEPGVGCRRCQVRIEWQGDEWIMFAPAGNIQEDTRYFEWYAQRINASGWRTRAFPSGVMMSGIYLAYSRLHLMDWSDSDISFACLRHAGFTDNRIYRMLARFADFTNSTIVGSRFILCDVTGASFVGAIFSGHYEFENHIPKEESASVFAEFLSSKIHRAEFSYNPTIEQILVRGYNRGTVAWESYPQSTD